MAQARHFPRRHPRVVSFERIQKRHSASSYVGRTSFISAIDDFVNRRTGSDENLLLVGAAGIGKTALCVQYARSRLQTITYFVEAHTRLVESDIFVDHVYYSLGSRFELGDDPNLSRPVSLPELEHRMSHINERFLKGHRVQLLMIDAIDESISHTYPRSSSSILSTLNTISIPPGFRLMMTSSHDLVRSRLVSTNLKLKTLIIPAEDQENRDDIRQYILANLERDGLDDTHVRQPFHLIGDGLTIVDRLAKASGGIFAYAELAMREFQRETSELPTFVWNPPQGFHALLQDRIDNALHSVDSEVCEAATSILIAIALFHLPMSRHTLSQALGLPERIAASAFALVARFCDPTLIHENDSFQLFHRSLRSNLPAMLIRNRAQQLTVLSAFFDFFMNQLRFSRDSSYDLETIHDLVLSASRQEERAALADFIREFYIPRVLSIAVAECGVRGYDTKLARLTRHLPAFARHANDFLFFSFLHYAVAGSVVSERTIPLMDSESMAIRESAMPCHLREAATEIEQNGGWLSPVGLLFWEEQWEFRHAWDRLHQFLIEYFSYVSSEFEDPTQICCRCAYHANIVYPLSHAPVQPPGQSQASITSHSKVHGKAAQPDGEVQLALNIWENILHQSSELPVFIVWEENSEMYIANREDYLVWLNVPSCEYLMNGKPVVDELEPRQIEILRCLLSNWHKPYFGAGMVWTASSPKHKDRTTQLTQDELTDLRKALSPLKRVFGVEFSRSLMRGPVQGFYPRNIPKFCYCLIEPPDIPRLPST